MKDYKKLYEDLLKEHEETVKLLEDVVYHAKEVVLENEALKMTKPIWRSILLKYGFVNVKISAATDFYLIYIKCSSVD